MVFKIENTSLSYDNQTEVLKIPSFKIDKAGVYFFIGASGIGKSTLLETLGMMNNTIRSGTSEVKYYKKTGEEVDLKELWQKDDQTKSQFRKSEYSFIFQNTNLMPHFTAGENMVYTLLLEGVSWEEAKNRVVTLMPSLGLNPLVFDKHIQYVSGGQRQRLAFVRAFVSSFEVLFGDEPTGNLDPVTAISMMKTLSDFVKTENKTAIIVSHDIQLASLFADRIYFIKKCYHEDGSSVYGMLESDQYFERQENTWMYNGNLITGNITEVLKKYL